MVNGQLGPDRCFMQKGKLRRFARGGGWIRILLDTGWEIVPDERNYLRGDYGQQPAVSEPAPMVEPRKRGRPRKS